MKRFPLIAFFLSSFAFSGCASVPVLPAPSTLTITDSFVAAEARLREAIAARGLRLFTVVDHGGGALTVGRDIGQSKLFIFGNPKGGTPLIEENPEFGLELPLKVLIYTDEGGRFRVRASDIRQLAQDYGIDGEEDRLKAMDKMLLDIMREAAG